MVYRILSTLLPVAIIIFLGWYAGKKAIINKSHSHSFATYVMNFSFPCLLFVVTNTMDPGHFSDLKVVLLFLIALMGMYVITFLIYKFLLRKSLAECGQGAITCAFPDMAFMGIPIFTVLFGTDSLIYIAIGNIVSSLIMIPATIILMETRIGQQKKTELFKNTIFPMFKKPLVIAPILGVITSLFNIHLPAPIQHAFQLIGSSTSGVSLFTLGLIMSSYAIKLTKTVALNIFLKNICHPIFMLALVYLFQLQGLVSQEGVLLCAMPTATMAAMFALKHDVLVSESTSTVILGTLASILTLSIFMWIVSV